MLKCRRQLDSGDLLHFGRHTHNKPKLSAGFHPVRRLKVPYCLLTGDDAAIPDMLHKSIIIV